MRALLVAVGIALLLPNFAVVAAPPAAAAPFAVMERRLLERTHGDLSVVGEHVVRHADGARSSERITAAEFLAHVRGLLDRTGYGTNGVAIPDIGVGFGIANQDLAKAVGWPYCDYVSVFVEWEGNFETSPIVEMDQSPVGDVAADPLCGGVYGPTHTYASVALDTTTGGGSGTLFSCSSAEFPGALTRLAPSPLGPLGNYACGGATSISLHGNLAIDVESWCFFGICIGFVAVLGGTAAMFVGDAGIIPA